MSRFNFAFAAAALVLGACATSTPYAPMDGRYGYAEQRIETNRYRVVFHGNSSTTRETVEAFLLYRAAELTLEMGSITSLLCFHRFPYYAYGYPWSYDSTVRERRRFEANAYIQMHKGEKPKGDVRAFDARDVIENLRPGVQQSLTPGS